jgi:Tetratricopeptide repeat
MELGDSMPRAIAIGEPLFADLERLLGPDDPDTMRSRNDLARAYREEGRVADAVPLVEQTLAARERLFGAGHPSTLASRNNLASAYRATGRAAEAIPLFATSRTPQGSRGTRISPQDWPADMASLSQTSRSPTESSSVVGCADQRGTDTLQSVVILSHYLCVLHGVELSVLLGSMGTCREVPLVGRLPTAAPLPNVVGEFISL